jgi:hypothetical protein
MQPAKRSLDTGIVAVLSLQISATYALLRGRRFHDKKDGEMAIREWIRKQQPSFQCDSVRMH